jgi:hypothetical protein
MTGVPDPGSTREAALDYARRGWAVFPLHSVKDGTCTCGNRACDSPGKHPRTERGFKDATTDEAVIRAWWGRWHSANVGIRTGTESGLVVVDVDPRHGGSIEAVEAAFGPLPTTPRALTGGGGTHLFFALPGFAVRNRVGILAGVDVRGDGGYIVAPPSRHASGGNYRWDEALDPSRAKPAPLPSRLCHALGQKQPRLTQPRSDGLRDKSTRRWAEAALGDALANVAEAPEGRRNDTLNTEAFNLGQIVAGGALDP